MFKRTSKVKDMIGVSSSNGCLKRVMTLKVLSVLWVAYATHSTLKPV